MSEDNRNSDSKVQGEGDYNAARRYRDNLTKFVNKADIDALASQAAPLSAKEARELALADERARARSKGDDPADVGIMYSHEKKPDTDI
jgi:phage I-like protein